MTCTATYTVTQTDLNNGSINDSATAAGTNPAGGTTPSTPSTAAVIATQTAALTITKSAAPTTVSAVGATVTYSFVVTNSGNVTLTNVTVADAQTAPAGVLASGPTCPAGAASMAPGASVTCTATYTVTQADLNNATIKDSATAAGKDPKNNTVTSPAATATVTTIQNPALTVVKSATPITVAAVGAVVTYSFVVTNSGNVTLTNVGVTDTQTAPAGALASGPTCPAGAASMAPGASVTCTATYTVTQADLNNGSINDSATAAGTKPGGGTTTSAPSLATVTATQGPALTIAKSASPTTVSAVGATVTYSFVVTNSGNVTLTNVAVTDTQTAPAGALTTGPTCPAGATSMAPGASVTCTATYTVTQADLNNGSIKDSATAAGKDPKNNTVTSAPASGHRDHDAEPGVDDRQVGEPDDGRGSRRDRDVLIRCHEQRQRDADQRRGHRHPDRARRGVDERPDLPGRRDVDGARRERHVYRDLHRDAGRPEQRIDQRLGDGRGDEPGRRYDDVGSVDGVGHGDAESGPDDHEVGDSDDGRRRSARW